MAYRLENPMWENDRRERIQADIIYEETGQRGRIIISKDTEDWDTIFEQTSIEDLDQHLADDLQRHKDRQARQQADRDRKAERDKQERLFQAKLALFEIDVVKDCKDRKLKSLIRKAKTETEAMLYASVLFNQMYDPDSK